MENLNSLKDGTYYDGTYEWEKDGDEWTPLLAPQGMPTHPNLDGLRAVEKIYVPVTFEEDSHES